ncbi:MAG: MmgE/PrpD family protein [Nocardioides sp.]|uniref:MmgE/PrpD family protein n=1 Tax=Nocardioides sp. TaxID=35761 RepID=UPI0039E53690
MGTTEERLAEFVAETPVDRIPAAALDGARRSVLDVVGCILAALPDPDIAPVLRLAPPLSADPDRPAGTVLGVGLRTDPASAALANGTLAHWLDYDDGRTACGHAASVLLPAALAAAEIGGAGGPELLAGYALGLEATTHLSDACHYEEKTAGFHRTSLFGTLGATAAAARILGLDAVRTRMALAIAASTGAGLCRNFGTATKPLHAGLGARNAITAALLAADGWTGSPEILGGPNGWSSYVGHLDLPAIADGLDALRRPGATWRTVARPPMIKAVPCCGASHGPLESLLGLIAEHGFSHRDVTEVEVGVPYDSMVLMYDDPECGFQGKFSLRYTIATALIDGRIEVDSFTDERLHRPEYAETSAKVRLRVTSKWDTSVGTGGNDHARFKPGDALPVVVRLRDGRRLTRATPRVSGLGEETELLAKFRANAARSLPAESVAAAASAWARLPELPDVRLAIDRTCLI